MRHYWNAVYLPVDHSLDITYRLDHWLYLPVALEILREAVLLS